MPSVFFRHILIGDLNTYIYMTAGASKNALDTSLIIKTFDPIGSPTLTVATSCMRNLNASSGGAPAKSRPFVRY